jgi:uncharacterized protein YceK
MKTCFLFVAAMLFLSGCSSLMESTKDKQINWDSQVYGFKITAFDPGTGTVAPVGEFGFGSIVYRSIPIEAGQPFFARYTVKSIWTSDPASETVIWIGRATEKSVLTFEAVPADMICITPDGIKTNSAELKITPEK